MRRTDREISQPKAMREILLRSKVCRVAWNTKGAPYILPLSLGAVWPDGAERPTLYFHCAAQGRKLELLGRDARVGFEADGGWALIEAERACGYGCAFESVVGTGRMQIVQRDEEKRVALEAIMYVQTGRTGFDFDRAALDAVLVLRLDVEEISAKRRAAKG